MADNERNTPIQDPENLENNIENSEPVAEEAVNEVAEAPAEDTSAES